MVCSITRGTAVFFQAEGGIRDRDVTGVQTCALPILLRAIGQYMLSAARGEDIVSRYGGEEFVLVMAPAQQGTVWERAEKLRREVQNLEIEYEGRRVGPITISVGIAIYPDHGESGQEVLRAADAALYQAKRSGRNCVVVGDKVKA